MGSINERLDSTTLLRDIYRALLNTGRTYACFEKRHIAILNKLKKRGVILDPMAGYGGTMKFCCELEPNLSSYLD